MFRASILHCAPSAHRFTASLRLGNAAACTQTPEYCNRSLVEHSFRVSHNYALNELG